VSEYFTAFLNHWNTSRNAEFLNCN